MNQQIRAIQHKLVVLEADLDGDLPALAQVAQAVILLDQENTEGALECLQQLEWGGFKPPIMQEIERDLVGLRAAGSLFD